MTTSEALPLEADPLPGTDAGEERLTRKDRAALRPAWRQPLALIGITIILAWIIIAIFAPELAPYPPNLQFAPLNVAPSHVYLFGTDELGRDVFSRVLYGARLSLPLAVLLVAVAMMIGSTLGAIAGFFSGVVDSVIMRIADVVFAFPGIILALAVAAALGAQLRNAVLAVIVVSWPSYSRLSQRAGARGSLIRVRHLGQAPGFLGLAYDVGRAAPEHSRPDLRTGGAGYRQCGAAFVGPFVPWAGGAAADSRMGFDGLGGRPELQQLVDRPLPRAGHPYRCAGVQFPRRRTA